jgi:polyferredoxin
MFKKTVQRIIQVAFLGLFLFLVSTGNVRLWMGLFLGSVLVSFLFGRIYCGWVCPINTVLGPLTALKRALHIKEIPIPRMLAKPWTRILFLLLFLAAFGFTAKTGKKLPVLPVLAVLGIATTILFPESFWHRYLCPYGSILSVSSKSARIGMKIDADKCNNCNACSNVCPALAIEKREKHVIRKTDCLACMQCQRVCKQGAITFGKEKKTLSDQR